MEVLFNRNTLNHNKNEKGEGPHRIECFEERLSETYSKIDGEKYLILAHHPSYINEVRKACDNNYFFSDSYATFESYISAITSVSLSLEASINGSFAITRPPGHHAGFYSTDGFCYFNNMGISSIFQKNLGKRVFIIDFDGHHGNGTQEIIKNEKNIFYASIHQENKWPFTGKNSYKNILNYPVKKGADDYVLLEWGKRINKEIKKFNPDIIGISAGFDGHKDDPLLELNFTEEGYKNLGSLIRLSQKKSLATLEGGYHSKLENCILNFIDGYNNS